MTGIIYTLLVTLLLAYAMVRCVSVQQTLQDASRRLEEANAVVLRLREENEALASAIGETAAPERKTD
ncbi:MAG: hypothetical protein IKQ10_08435 [Oscillospiraceae bacterium]|nr:hypothetical protein [Oscillospiraceae bacterium]